jgi:hypothetical protein
VAHLIPLLIYVEWRLSASARDGMQLSGILLLANQGSPARRRPHRKSPTTSDSELGLINIVGTVERYNEWLALAQSILSKSFPSISLAPLRQSVTDRYGEPSYAAILTDLKKNLGPELAERLLSCNYLDMCLHQVADALLTRRLAEHGIGIVLTRAYRAGQQTAARESLGRD